MIVKYCIMYEYPMTKYRYRDRYCGKPCAYLGAKQAELIRVISQYGMSFKEYELLIIAQNNRCAICNKPESQQLNGKLKRLAVDHCHTTGKVRGLLCQRCNTDIGFFNDDWCLVNRAMDYLIAGDLKVGINQRMGNRNVNA